MFSLVTSILKIHSGVPQKSNPNTSVPRFKQETLLKQNLTPEQCQSDTVGLGTGE